MPNRTAVNLRRLTSQMGLTSHQVAQQTGLDQRTIRAMLDGSNRPHPATLHRLAKGLGVSPDEFFLEPSQLLYRFNAHTNPAVAEIVESRAELFADWTQSDFEELHSRFGTGGPLTVEGALAAVEQMNRNRSVHEKLALLLQSGQADLVRGIVETMYEKLRVVKG
jgi:transcriptional regulator with XRE-family HTH domain